MLDSSFRWNDICGLEWKFESCSVFDGLRLAGWFCGWGDILGGVVIPALALRAFCSRRRVEMVLRPENAEKDKEDKKQNVAFSQRSCQA